MSEEQSSEPAVADVPPTEQDLSDDDLDALDGGDGGHVTYPPYL
ncbi:hypothetical protein [Streptomyces sp. NPDC086010]